MLKENLHILTSKHEYFKAVVQKFSEKNEDNQLLPLYITTIVSDFVYLQFQIEEEDLIKVLQSPKVLEDSEITKLIGDIEKELTVISGQELLAF